MRLIDCFIEAIFFVANLVANAEKAPLPLEDVGKEVERLLAESEKKRKEGQFEDDDYNQAKFAYCAWADEAILTSKWPHVDLWRTELLQSKYFNTTNAGEEFFERLNHIPEENKGVLEVYLTCLELGFKGRYHTIRDSKPLEAINLAALQQFMGGSDILSSVKTKKLFPWGYLGKTEMVKRRGWQLLTYLITGLLVAGPVGLLVGAYYAYFATLENLLQRLIYIVK